MIPTWLVALFAGASVIWSQLKSIAQWFISIFFVTVIINDRAGQTFIPYIRKQYRQLSLGERGFSYSHRYIRPHQRYGKIAVEKVGTNLVFMNGVFPLFVSTASDGNRVDDMMKVSFIRGTFDITDLLAKSATHYNEFFSNKTPESFRFRIRRISGKSMKTNHTFSGNEARAVEESAESRDGPGFKPIGWSITDLGAPKDDSPFEHLSYEKEVMNLVNDIKRWNKSQAWYTDHNLSWRYGCLLYGPPGTGKTSFIRAIAQELDLPIDIYDLSDMDNNEFAKSWTNSLEIAPCIVLLEDFDRQMVSLSNTKTINDTVEDNGVNFSFKKQPITLDQLLNCISGVEPTDGIFLAITANDISKLDEALGIPKDGKSTRPGRIDKIIYFDKLSESGRLKIASKILSDSPEFIEQTVKDGEGETGDQFVHRCAQLALKCYWEPKAQIG